MKKQFILGFLFIITFSANAFEIKLKGANVSFKDGYNIPLVRDNKPDIYFKINGKKSKVFYSLKQGYNGIQFKDFYSSYDMLDQFYKNIYSSTLVDNQNVKYYYIKNNWVEHKDFLNDYFSNAFKYEYLMSIGNSRYTEFNGSKDVIPKSRYGITANPLASSFKVGAYEYSGTLGNTYLGGKSLSLSTAFKKAVLCHVSNSKQNCKQEISIKINKGLKLYFEVSFDKEFSSLFADNEKSNLKSFIKKVDKFKSSEFCLILKGSPWAVGRNSVRGDYGIITSSNSILEKLDQSHIHSFAKENLAPIILGSAVANYGSFDEYYEKAITKKLKSLNCKKIEYIDYLVPF